MHAAVGRKRGRPDGSLLSSDELMAALGLSAPIATVAAVGSETGVEDEGDDEPLDASDGASGDSAEEACWSRRPRLVVKDAPRLADVADRLLRASEGSEVADGEWSIGGHRLRSVMDPETGEPRRCKWGSVAGNMYWVKLPPAAPAEPDPFEVAAAAAAAAAPPSKRRLLAPSSGGGGGAGNASTAGAGDGRPAQLAALAVTAKATGGGRFGAPVSYNLAVPHPTRAGWWGVPRAWGMSAFGLPASDNRFVGLPLAAGLALATVPGRELREDQELAVQRIVDACRLGGHAFLEADCGFGECAGLRLWLGRLRVIGCG